MKYLALILALLVTSTIFAAEPPEKPEKPQTAPPVTNAPPPRDELIIIQYKFRIEDIRERVDNLDNLKYYENWIARNTSTNTEIKITDLTDIQRGGFFLFRGEELHDNICQEVVKWRDVITKYADMKFPEDINITKEEQEKLLAENKKIAKGLSELILELREVHVELAEKREKLVNDLIKKHEDEKQLVKELKEYLENLKVLHNKMGLIDRKEAE